MSKRSVRWGRTHRLLTATAVGVVAVPTVLAAAAYAGTVAGSPPPPVPPPLTAPVTPKPPTLSVLKDQWGSALADKVSKDATGLYQPQQDPGSLFTVTTAIGARAVWGQKDAAGRAITGQGVTVALLDSGVSPVAGLTGAGKVVAGPDLSLEAGNPAVGGLDTFGHGTHLAGIIAADDAVAFDPKTGAPLATTPASELGVAPGAGLLAVKLATATGTTDVSEVIAGLDWVSEHAHDNGMNVRVVNLSFGTDSLQPYQVDPLAAAAENAWHHGIVVVVSGGNEGPTAGRLTDPAIDPYVIAVGASDPNLAVNGWKSPTVASFSSSGTAARHVDLLAPGTSITSLRDPGSYIDDNHPEGLVAGDLSGRLFRGSGTSQAAAVVSGAAALLVQANPNLTPDEVKAALTTTATPLVGVSVVDQGAGEINVAAAVKAATPTKTGTIAVGTAAQTAPAATGTGSLEAARAGNDLTDPDTGAILTGEVDVQGQPFTAAAWDAASVAGTAWTGGLWNGARWNADSWSAAGWSSARWSDSSWDGARWSDSSWDGARWSGARWSDASWDSARWSDAAWDAARWSDAAWD